MNNREHCLDSGSIHSVRFSKVRYMYDKVINFSGCFIYIGTKAYHIFFLVFRFEEHSRLENLNQNFFSLTLVKKSLCISVFLSWILKLIFNCNVIISGTKTLNKLDIDQWRGDDICILFWTLISLCLLNCSTSSL